MTKIEKKNLNLILIAISNILSIFPPLQSTRKLIIHSIFKLTIWNSVIEN